MKQLTHRPAPVKPRATRRITVAIAGLASLALALSACALDTSSLEGPTSNPSSAVPSSPSPTANLPAPDGLEFFYGQKVEWNSCGKNGAQCATVTAPLDYANPSEDDTIELSAKRYPATGEKIGTLFFNPGGPGGSGNDFIDSLYFALPSELSEHFDIASWDPRGINESTPVDCLTDEELDEAIAESADIETEEGWAHSKEYAQKVADKCEERSGRILPFVGTESTARDLDLLRHLVGDAKLNFLGSSYGTFIGAQYADLFPENVGRMVLDGAVDTTMPRQEADYTQWMGFETAARKYVEQCSGADCPLTGSDDDKLRQIQALIDSCVTDPIPTSDSERPLTASLAVYGIILPLYSSQYDMLSLALDQALKRHDGSMLLYFADQYSERASDGHYLNNSSEAFWAVNCADYLPVSDEDTKEMGERLEADSLAFGGSTSGPDMCAAWPYHPQANPGPFKAEGSAPIIVVGTEFDPATPYEWAVAVEGKLDNGRLLTWKGGEGHTAFLRGSSCIDTTIVNYFVDGTVPEEDTVCS